METKELTKELILNVCNYYIAKSRYFDSTFIHRQTGQKMTLRQTATFIGLTVQNYCVINFNKRLSTSGAMHQNKVVLEAIKDFDYLSEIDCNKITAVYRPWVFFNEYTGGRSGEKILGPVMLKHYQQSLGRVSGKYFYQELKQWAAENQFKLTFKNILKNRKVILEL